MGRAWAGAVGALAWAGAAGAQVLTGEAPATDAAAGFVGRMLAHDTAAQLCAPAADPAECVRVQHASRDRFAAQYDAATAARLAAVTEGERQRANVAALRVTSCGFKSITGAAGPDYTTALDCLATTP